MYLLFNYSSVILHFVSSYDYTICPFDNITQVDVVTRWNPYKGVLGVYDTWEVQNGLFSAIIYRNGDACGSKRREVRVCCWHSYQFSKYQTCNDMVRWYLVFRLSWSVRKTRQWLGKLPNLTHASMKQPSNLHLHAGINYQVRLYNHNAALLEWIATAML